MGDGKARRTCRWSWLVALAVVGGGAAGCYDSTQTPPIDPPPECADSDGDGRGVGEGCFGPDCDDADVTVWDTCGVSCLADPRAPGCACDGAVDEPEICYAGPAGTSGVGACTSGVRLCRDAGWSACEGQVLPTAEVCDGTDNDCDGTIDQGVQGACGDCDPACVAACVGVGCPGRFTTTPGAEIEPDGSVVVSGEADQQPHEIWIVDQQASSVLRVDTQTFEVLGAYRTGPGQGADAPSSVAVDGDGTAYVVNSRQAQGPTTLTKIRAWGCPDADGDGRIETSTDDESLRWEEDECVAWNVEVEACGGWSCGYGWSIALTDEGRSAWVALYQGGRVVEVDTELGEPTGREVSVSSPIGLAVGADGAVWIASSSRTLRRFFPDAPEDVDSFTLNGQSWVQSLDVDAEGRVLVTSPLGRFDPDTEQETSSGWTAYDVAVDDDDGAVWGVGGGSSIRRYEADLADYDSFTVSNAPLQLATDRDGHVWAAQQWGGEPIVIVDRATGEEVASELGGCAGSCLSAPVLEGDPTGVRFRRAFGGGAGTAIATHVFETTCEGIVEWRAIGWEATGGEVQVSARSGDSVAELQVTPWVQVGMTPPDAGTVEQPSVGGGTQLEVSATLRGRESRLARITVEWSCWYE